MQQATQTTQSHPTVIYKGNNSPRIPTVYDFRRFMGYAGEFPTDSRDYWPVATD